MTSPAPTEHRDYWNKYQAEPTTLVWGCGHTAAVRLALNPIVAAEQIAAYSQFDCLPCAKAKKAQTRGITWADANRGR
jgi:hypothetical protein